MSWLAANTAFACVLAVLVLLASTVLRRVPAVVHALWLFVLLRLVMPPVVAMPLPSPWPEAPPVVVPIESLAWFASAPGIAAAPITAEPFDWVLLGSIVWGLGSGLCLGGIVLGIARSQRYLRRLPPVPAWLAREVASLAAAMSVRVPVMRDDASAPAPYVWSFGRALLCVPVARLAAVPERGRAAVLVHELAHLRRRDHWTAHGELLLQVLLWWHPLFWFARARLRQWAELACDAWATAVVPGAQLDYAGVLIAAAAEGEPAVPALAVLAARPAAVSAFQRRLKMILNENVSCRLSRAWLLPVAAFGLCLFATPVIAQGEPKPRRLEVTVNGQDLRELSLQQRCELLKRLVAETEQEASAAQGRAAPDKKPAKEKAPKAKAPKVKEEEREGDAAGARDLLKRGLLEAKLEIGNDKDLAELGIQPQVMTLIDSIGEGGDFQTALDGVIKAAMKGAGRMAVKEIRADPDIARLGLGDGLEKLVHGLLSDERNQEMLLDFAKKAMRSALKDAKVEIHADMDLQKLGITEDVSGLLDSLMDGKGDFGTSLQQVIEKAMRAAGDVDEEEAAPAKAKKVKAKKGEARR